MKKSISLAIISWLTLFLGGCGAGGDVTPIATTGVPITQFIGVWQNNNPDPICQPHPNGNYYSEGVMRLTGATYIESYDFYSDANCTLYLGALVNIFDITWSIPTSSTTKTGVMRAVISNPKYTSTGAIVVNGIASDPSISYKALFYVENNTLRSYFDVATPSNLLDADGYPLGVDSALFTYTRTNLSAL